MLFANVHTSAFIDAYWNIDNRSKLQNIDRRGPDFNCGIGMIYDLFFYPVARYLSPLFCAQLWSIMRMKLLRICKTLCRPRKLVPQRQDPEMCWDNIGNSKQHKGWNV